MKPADKSQKKFKMDPKYPHKRSDGTTHRRRSTKQDAPQATKSPIYEVRPRAKGDRRKDFITGDMSAWIVQRRAKKGSKRTKFIGTYRQKGVAVHWACYFARLRAESPKVYKTQVLIFNKNGQIAKNGERTYPRSRDPRRSKG